MSEILDVFVKLKIMDGICMDGRTWIDGQVDG